MRFPPIQSFSVERFKSYAKATLRLSPLTLLVGPNASGKSNLIEAMRLLSWLARGKELGQLTRDIADGDLAVRGRAQDLPREGSESFRLGCQYPAISQGIWSSLNVTVRVNGGEPRIIAESIEASPSMDDLPLYQVRHAAEKHSHDIQVAYNNFAKGGNKPQIICTDQQLVLTQLGTPARFGDRHVRSQKEIPRVTQAFSGALRRSWFFEAIPGNMRGYADKEDIALSEDGSNLSAVLYFLCRELERGSDILEFIRDLPEQDIRGVGFIETDRGDVMVKLTETFAGREKDWDAAALSDGTLRVLAIAAAVLGAPQGSLVVIEEVDNGVHPSRARKLLENIQRVAKERGLHVLLTSHNPALMDALPDEAIPHVACCFRDPQDGTSRLVHLSEIPRYPELIAQGTLGRLVTAGILERYLKDTRSTEERKKQALKWIEKHRKAKA
ncbi:ATP-binding protein [bacterium]|nr:ATP-binding protein [bacterium]